MASLLEEECRELDRRILETKQRCIAVCAIQSQALLDTEKADTQQFVDRTISYREGVQQVANTFAQVKQTAQIRPILENNLKEIHLTVTNELNSLLRRVSALEKEQRLMPDRIKKEERQVKEKEKTISEGYASRIHELTMKLEEKRQLVTLQKAAIVMEVSREEPQLGASEPILTDSAELPHPEVRKEPDLSEVSPAPISIPPIRTTGIKQSSSPKPKSFTQVPKRVSASDLDIESFLGSAATALLTRNKK